MPMVGTGHPWAVRGAVLAAECRELLKGLKNATPLGSENTEVLTLKNLVNKTQREKVCLKKTPTTNKPTKPNQQQQPKKATSQNLVFSFGQRELLLADLAKQKLHLC